MSHCQWQMKLWNCGWSVFRRVDCLQLDVGTLAGGQDLYCSSETREANPKPSPNLEPTLCTRVLNLEVSYAWYWYITVDFGLWFWVGLPFDKNLVYEGWLVNTRSSATGRIKAQLFDFHYMLDVPGYHHDWISISNPSCQREKMEHHQSFLKSMKDIIQNSYPDRISPSQPPLHVAI